MVSRNFDIINLGEMKLLDLNTKNIVNLEVLPGETPVVVKWCPKKPGVAAIGYKSGRISFVDINI